MAYTGFITISTDAPNISEQAVTGEGASVLSNPKLLDDRARFNLIDESPGIIRYDSIAGSSTRWNCIVAKGENGAPLYVRVGEGGAIESSPDVVTWTSQTSGTVNMLNFVIYDSYTSKYWAVGASGTVLSSSDGITWSAVSLPVGVASDNLSGIATDGSGTFVISNGSSGSRGLVSTDGGGTFAIVNFDGATQTMIYTGDWFIGGRISGPLGAVAYASASNPTGTWGAGTLSDSAGFVQSIIVSGDTVIIGTGNGDIGTIPRYSSTPSTGNITLRRTGTGEAVRLFAANGRVYAVGQNGISLESTDNGETWVAGPAVGTTDFMRFGMSDPVNPTRAIVVGDSGVTLFGQYPFYIICYESDTDRTNRGPELGKVQEAYVDTPKRVVVPGLLEIDVGSVFP